MTDQPLPRLVVEGDLMPDAPPGVLLVVEPSGAVRRYPQTDEEARLLVDLVDAMRNGDWVRREEVSE